MRVGAGEAADLRADSIDRPGTGCGASGGGGDEQPEVASELFISIKTVQYHVTHIYAKLGVRSRAELAAQFRERELPL